MNTFRIAHFSDPHFSHITYDLSQFLSKRWIGNLNLALNRQRSYQTEHLWYLPELMSTLKVQTIFITGDFSSTSLDQEFLEGKKFVNAFKERGLPTYVLPGNHDCYTKAAERDRSFFHFFPSEELQQERIESLSLNDTWSYIGLDCAVATPPFCSYGNFSKELEERLSQRLAHLPPSQNVIVANHFPLLPSKHPFHGLKRAHALQEVLKKFPQVKLYLHGHDHKLYTIDRQQEGLPLILNSGSVSLKPEGSFYLIDLFQTECLVQRILFRKIENAAFSWIVDWQRRFSFKN